MSHFYLTAVNSRGNTVTAAGSKSGQDCHLRGWNLGIEVIASVGSDGRDEFRVWVTGGSNGGSKKFLACVSEREPGEWGEFQPHISLSRDIEDDVLLKVAARLTRS